MINRKYLHGGLMVAALVVVTLVVAIPVVAQSDNRNYPLWVNVPGVALQMTTFPGVPTPASPNNGKYYLAGQLVRNTTLQPPFVGDVLPILDWTIEQAPNSSTIFGTPTCSIQGGTWLTCEFGPSAPTWGSAGSGVFRLKVRSTNGFGAITLVSLRVN